MWRTSSRSGPDHDCVEAASWRTSTASGSNGDCVEVGHGIMVGVRDSKDRGGGLLEVPPAAWTAFTGRLKTGPRQA